MLYRTSGPCPPHKRGGESRLLTADLTIDVGERSDLHCGLISFRSKDRAWEIVSQCPSEPFQKALAEYWKQSGAALMLGDAGAIGKAAAEGRVAVLFLSENAGAGGQPDDPLNLAALETVLHGG